MQQKYYMYKVNVALKAFIYSTNHKLIIVGFHSLSDTHRSLIYVIYVYLPAKLSS